MPELTGAEKCAEYTEGEHRHLGRGVFVPQPTQFREICLDSRAIAFYLFSRSTKILTDSVFPTVSLNPVVGHEINLTSQRPTYFKSGIEKERRSLHGTRLNIVSRNIVSVKYSRYCVYWVTIKNIFSSYEFLNIQLKKNPPKC